MSLSKSELLSCWPDGYSRYYTISNILRLAYGTKKVSILDVGGDSQWMSQFLDSVKLNYQLSIVDTREPDFKNESPRIRYVREDFFKVKSTEFPAEVVMNTDVLEHIPADLKIPFVNQCIKFAKDMVIFSAPQEKSEVTYAEKQIDNNYKKYTKKQQYWLKEHFEFGKPDPVEVEKAIKKQGYPYLALDTNNLENWLVSFSMNLINSEISGLTGMDELNRFYNKNVHSVGDYGETAYRKVFIVFKDQALYKKVSAQIDDFFKPDATKKIEFLGQAFDVLANNIKQMTMTAASRDKTIQELTAELEKTQEAFVNAQTELSNIKSSRSYRYTKKINKVVRHR